MCIIGYSGDGTTCNGTVIIHLTCSYKRLSHRIDINECDDGTASCDVNAQCINTDGSYTCSCSSGYSGDGINCAGKIHTTTRTQFSLYLFRY